MKNIDKFINVNGDFEFPNFLYHTIMSLMKSTLDLGTLACSNPNQLRAFKETTKKNFKSKWKEIAQILETFDLITPCICNESDFCEICGGSRFTTNDILTSDFVHELVMFVSDGTDDKVQQELELGLQKAIRSVEADERSGKIRTARG